MKFNGTVCFGFLLIITATTAWSDVGPLLTLSRSGPQCTLNWGGKGILETSESVGGPWREVALPQSPYHFQATTNSAFFRVRVPQFLLEVTVAGNGTGSVASDPAGIQCGNTCSGWFLQDTVVKLTATADGGSRFVAWGGDGSGTGVCQVVMNSAKTVTATFEALAAEGLVNGDFEQGPGVGWTEKPGTVIYRADQLGVAAPSGQYIAWIGYWPDDRHSASISQQVTLPDVWPLYLNYWLNLYSEEICDAGYWDTFGLYVNGQPVVENGHLCNGNTGGDGWRRVSTDISAYAGQTVEITFEIASGWYDPLASVALLDDLSLSQVPW